MNPMSTHLDCRNYAPVDVLKGVCHRTKDLILGDDTCCEQFERTAKCKFCSRFEAGTEPYLGTCSATAGRPLAYPDMVAVTCEWFEARESP
jgi:4-hydroxyphenylacetate decarboxylase small subunit